MYSLEFAKPAVKALKKLPRKLRDKFLEEADKIPYAPYGPEKLQPPLQKLRSYHFTFKGTHYRIAYLIDKKEKKIFVVLLGSHEGFYEKLRRLIG